MIQKIKSQLVILASLLLFAVPTLAPAVVSAQGCSTNTADQIAVGASKASSGNVDCSSSDNATTGIGNVAAHVVNIFSIIVGIVAVIMIIYGGFRYITSGGDSGSVGNAKNTLIYAIVGLIIVALAQVIVHFVLSTTNGVTQ
jgi:energy-converting hydrogenase Eha subunit B